MIGRKTGLGRALALAILVSAGPAQDLAVKAGKIITMAGTRIKDGVILIRNGKIDAVGKYGSIKIPMTVKVLDASKSVVMPAFVLAHTSQGLDRANENMPVVPFISAADGLNPVDPFFEDLRRGGYGAVHVMPGNNCILGGTGIVVKPFGLSIEAMLIADPRIQKISLTRSNTGRIKAVDMLWKAFEEMEEEIKEKKEVEKEERELVLAKGEKPGKRKKELFPEEKRNLEALVNGKGRAFFYCASRDDIKVAMSLRKKYGFEITLLLANKCWKYAGMIKEAGFRVILDPQMEYVDTDPLTGKEKTVCPAKEMFEKGVEFALTTLYGSSLPERYPLWQAATAVKWGVPENVALSAITKVPAGILGLEGRLGTIEKGKDADIVILTGDPLDYRTWVDKVLVDGEVIYEREKDPVMKKFFGKEGKK